VQCADFDSVEDYYAAGGSHQRVHNVKIPLLVVQAEDDPIAPIVATPEQTLLENPHCILAGVLEKPLSFHHDTSFQDLCARL
jgi:predicted alpha/beta-fold hydrolase